MGKGIKYVSILLRFGLSNELTVINFDLYADKSPPFVLMSIPQTTTN